jgi:hypothetical protein
MIGRGGFGEVFRGVHNIRCTMWKVKNFLKSWSSIVNQPQECCEAHRLLCGGKCSNVDHRVHP